jgi:hypothetical protein
MTIKYSINSRGKRVITFTENAVENADWIKKGRWDLLPYKSKQFMETCGDLESFKKTPTYKWAVERGDIVDDEWARPEGWVQPPREIE